MNATLTRGDTLTRLWRLKDSAGVAIDLTGATARLQLRDSRMNKIAEASTATDEIVINGAAGVITLTIAASITREFQVGRYKFDLEVTDSNGNVKTYESGVLSVLADVSY